MKNYIFSYIYMKIDQYQKESVNRRRAICEMDDRIYGQTLNLTISTVFKDLKEK